MSTATDASAKGGANRKKGSAISSLFNATKNSVSKTLEEGTLVRRPKEIVTFHHGDKFQYTPLPHRQCIRLLTIKPGKNEDMIGVDMRIEDLRSRPKYTALSYSWERDRIPTPTLLQALDYIIKYGKGLTWDNLRSRMGWSEDQEDPKLQTQTDPNKKEGNRYILCNGKNFSVWPNLYYALLQLRQNRPGDYWIDAICMNQANSEEKGHQLQMMGHIYESAENVVVWLGTCPMPFETGIKQFLTTDNLRDKDPSREHKARLFFSVAWLLSSRWFRRLWVLQEACLAKEITFFYGEYQISARMLITAIDWLAVPNTYGAFAPFANMLMPYWSSHLKYVPAILNSRDEFKQGGKWPLHRWLEATKGRKTTNVQDFVYAGLGLVEPESLRIDTTLLFEEESTPALPARPGTAHFPPSTVPESTLSLPNKRRLWPAIRADIKMDPIELFLNVAACLLSQPNGIDLLLSYGQRVWHSNPNEQKSWTDTHPDLTNAPSWMFNPTSSASRAATSILTSDLGLTRPVFSACTQLSGYARIIEYGMTLCLDVIVLDTIEGDTGALVWGSGQVLEIFSQLPTTYEATGEDTIAAMAHTVISGLWNDTYPPSEEAVRAFKVWLCKGLPFDIDDNSSKKPSKEPIPSQLAEPSQPQQLEGLPPEVETRKKRKRVNGEAKKYGELHEKMYKETVEKFPQHDWLKLDDPVTEEDHKLLEHYEKTLWSLMPFRTLFDTKRGMFGLGPSWLGKGDAVMLVKGASLPYVFRHVDEDLRKQIAARQKDLKDPKKGGIKGVAMRLKREIKELEAKIGKEDVWKLVGETYVHGVMSGEAAVPSECRRIRVV